MCCNFNPHKDIAAKPLTEDKTFFKNVMENAEMKEKSVSHSAFNCGLQMYLSMHHISAKIQNVSRPNLHIHTKRILTICYTAPAFAVFNSLNCFLLSVDFDLKYVSTFGHAPSVME